MRTLQSINLNLLPVLRELLRTKSVTRAAEALGKSQPATSEALAQLRQHFDDELLVPVGRSYTLTTRARRIQDQLHTALDALDAMVFDHEFEPETAVGTVRIASNDYVILTWGRLLAAHLAARAPGVSLEFEDATIHSAEHLAAGRIDFITLPATSVGLVQDSHDVIGLFDDDLVCLVPAASSIRDVISREALSRLPHAIYAPGGSVQHSVGCTTLRQEAIPYHIRISVPVFSLLPELVASSGVIAITHRKLAQSVLSELAVRSVELPFPSPVIRVVIVSTQDARRHKLLNWMREQIAAVSLKA